LAVKMAGQEQHREASGSVSAKPAWIKSNERYHLLLRIFAPELHLRAFLHPPIC
jgi:hypothetical protein